MKKLFAGLTLATLIAVPMTASASFWVHHPRQMGSPTMGTGATVTWSLMNTGTSCADEFAGCTITSLADFMPSGYLTQVQAAFDAWAAVANLSFVFVADNGVAFQRRRHQRRHPAGRPRLRRGQRHLGPWLLPAEQRYQRRW